ncbi:glycosyltransferase [bacterium]|nr:glycosyltransferase [bacterium]
MISVILPFYNAENTLARAIQSVLNQSGVQLQLILVNNNSSDNSRAVAAQFSAENQNIILVDEAKQGVVFAMNKGLELANGTYIARMDADDIWFADKLRKQLAFLEHHNEIELLATQVAYQAERPLKGLQAYVAWSNAIQTPDDISKMIFAESPLINPSIMFKASLVERFGYYRQGDFPEDYEMFLRWHANGVKMAKLNETLMQWTDSDTRLTRTHAAYSPEAFNTIKCQYLSQWLKTNNHLAPKVWVWGAGRKTRRKAEELTKYGVQIEGYIDLFQGRTNRKQCIAYTDLKNDKSKFVLSFVSNRGRSTEIRNYLKSIGLVETEDFIMAS